MQYLLYIGMALCLFACSNNEKKDNKSDFARAIERDYCLDEADRDRLERNYPQTLKKIDCCEQIDVQDVKNLTRSGIADSVIMYEIYVTGSLFCITPDEESDLRHAGVSTSVIEYMKKI